MQFFGGGASEGKNIIDLPGEGKSGGSSINNISPILAKMSYIHQINQEIKLHLLRQK